MAELPRIGEQDNEVLNAQTHIWNHMFSFIKSSSLKCAVELNIPDIIHKHPRPMTLPELADAIPINKAKTAQLGRLMRALIHSGFFAETKIQESEGERGYSLTPPSVLLLKDNPLSARSLLIGLLDPIFMQPWHHVSEWFQNDDPTTFVTAHEMTFWDCVSHKHNPKLSRLFNEAMASDTRVVMSMVMKYCKGVFEGLNSVVDVGGGTGTAANIIADAFPDLKCTVFDLPHVVQGLVGTKNLDYVGGDMFVSIPPADAIFLKTILHDWSDEESVEILKKCRGSISNKEKGGKVVIIDIVMDYQGEDDKSIETQNFMDMVMMVYLTGKQRTEEDWAKLFLEAGFSDYKIIPILKLRCIIEVYP